MGREDDVWFTNRGNDIDSGTLEWLFENRVSTLAKKIREPDGNLSLIPRGRFDVDELSRESEWIYRIHFSSSVRESVLSSRYLTITGVASERPQSFPAPTVTARAPAPTRPVDHQRLPPRLMIVC